MRRPWILLVLLLLIAASSAYGKTNYYLGAVAAESGSPPETFCDTAGIFCMDAESGSQVTMVAGTSDEALDNDGDYYLQYSAVHKNGSYALAIRGSGATYYSRDALDSTSSEFYCEGWFRTNSGTLANRIFIVEDAANAEVVKIQKDSNYGLNAVCNGTTWDAGNDHIPSDTYVYIGFYYKEETGPGNNDGIVRVWLNTDGSTFDAGDLLINQTSVDTVSNDAAKFRFSGPYAGYISYFDDTRVTSGACPWAFE